MRAGPVVGVLGYHVGLINSTVITGSGVASTPACVTDNTFAPSSLEDAFTRDGYVKTGRDDVEDRDAIAWRY